MSSPGFPPPPASQSSPGFPPPPPSQSSPGYAPPSFGQSFPPPPASPAPAYPPPPSHAISPPPQLQQPTAQKPYNYAVPASAPAHQTSFNHASIHARQNSYGTSGVISEQEQEEKKFTLLQKKGRVMTQEVASVLKPNAGPSLPGIPAQGQFQGAGATSTADDVGTFNGGSYRVSHRDTNTIITIQLAMGCPITAKPGVMIAMSPSITLKGAIKFSMKKFLIGGEMSLSTFTGPGELLLAPSALGDVGILRLGGDETWSVGKDAFVACTQGVVKEYKSQSISKAMFSGEGLFVYKMSGSGILWFSTFGAIIKKDVSLISPCQIHNNMC